jgi:hypothetical protein
VNGTLGSLLWFPFNTIKSLAFKAYRALAFSGVAAEQQEPGAPMEPSLLNFRFKAKRFIGAPAPAVSPLRQKTASAR